MGCNRWVSGGFLNQAEWDEGEIGVNKQSGQSKQDRVVKWIWGELNMWGENQLRTWGILVKEDSSFINTEGKKKATVTYSRSIHPSIYLCVIWASWSEWQIHNQRFRAQDKKWQWFLSASLKASTVSSLGLTGICAPAPAVPDDHSSGLTHVNVYF